MGFKAAATSLGKALARSGLNWRSDFLRATAPFTLAGIAHLFRFILEPLHKCIEHILI